MWEIYSYGSAAFMASIFNGVAMIIGNDDYLVVLKIVAIVTILYVMVQMAAQTQRFTIGWLFVIVFVLTGLLVPRKDVIITDQLVPANSTVVSNVPVGLVAPAVFFSRFGHWAASSFETVFSLPNEIQYHGNGLLFAQTLVEESTRFEFVTPRLSENYTEFFKSCVAYDLLFDLYSWDDLLMSDDIHSFLKSNTSEARSFTYRPGTGSPSIINCRTGYSTQMETDLNAEITAANTILGGRLALGDTTVIESITRFTAAMPVAYSYLSGLSLTQSRIMSQNMLSNALRRGLTSSVSEDGPAGLAQEYAIARAEQERRTTFAALGTLAKRWLPILQTLFEAFIYASFPLVAILMLLPTAGKVAIGYVSMLFWINLWPPLYAVLHYAMSFFSQQAATREMVQNGTGFPSALTSMSHTGLGQIMYDYSVVAGYLSISIPFLAFFFVRNSGAMAAGMASRVLSSYEKPVSTGADEASTGNIGMGNSRFETSTAFQQNTAPSSKTLGVEYGDGIHTTRVSPHSTMTDLKESKTPLAVDYGSTATAMSRSALANASAAEQRASSELATSNAALLSNVEQLNRSIRESDAGQSVVGTTNYTVFTASQQNLDRAIASSSASDSVTDDNVRSLSAGLGASVRAGLGTPGISPIDAGVGIGANATGSYADRLTNSEQAAELKQALSSREVSEALSAYGQAARTLSANYSFGTDDTLQDSISSSLNSQRQASERYSVASQDVTTASIGFEAAQQVGSSLNVKGSDGYFNYLSDLRGFSQEDIRSLVSEVNQGNQAAITRNNELVSGYVQSELASAGYSPQLPPLNQLGEGGQFAGRDAGFGSATSSQSQLLNRADQAIQRSLETNQDEVIGANTANRTSVDNANPNDFFNRDAAAQYPADVSSDAFMQQMGNPRNLMVPSPGYEASRSEIQESREQMQEHHQSEKETGIWRRQLDKIK